MFQKLFLVSILLGLCIYNYAAEFKNLSPKVGKRVELKFKTIPNTIIRTVKSRGFETYYFTVCNGNNKGKCGYWYHPSTGKKDTKKGLPTFNKNKSMLIIPKVVMGDTGLHATDIPENSLYYLIVVKK
ncbi:hypothetical protein CAEBREN_31216 [Caenorhabditis brenneri]|uniref:Uncharacterized protein n=1 Tax=Caenorhabditis brenneri TaxID=135651 RepID=G0PF33_CAEBE|nr:hypothetical protein CAEBREN_31216 [Caenorhabditis brenneri]